MRILHVTTFLSPSANGLITLVRQLARALANKGHEVGIFTSDFELSKEYIGSLYPVKIYAYPSWFSLRGLYLYLSPGMFSEAKRVVEESDIIHLHSFRSFQNIVIHHYAKRYGVPYVVDAHGSTPRMAGGRRGFKWMLKWLFDVIFGYKLLKDASRVIAQTEVGVSEYKELGVNKGKIILISPPFDIKEFSQLPSPGLFRQKYNVKEKRIVLFLGRIHWIKGLDFLVESFSELAKSRSDVTLVIVGPDDGYKSTLDKLIEDLDLPDRVLFTGFLGGEEKLSALVDADLLVQTSVYEQGAWAPFEAILCNTPIIVSSNSGAGEDVRRIDAGYLVEYGNKNELKDKIQYVLDSPAEAKKKTQKAKGYIKSKLSLDKGIEKYEELYEELSSRRHK